MYSPLNPPLTRTIGVALLRIKAMLSHEVLTTDIVRLMVGLDNEPRMQDVSNGLTHLGRLLLKYNESSVVPQSHNHKQ